MPLARAARSIRPSAQLPQDERLQQPVWRAMPWDEPFQRRRVQRVHPVWDEIRSVRMSEPMTPVYSAQA